MGERASILRTACSRARELAAVDLSEKAQAVVEIKKRSKEAPELYRAYEDLAKAVEKYSSTGLSFFWKLGREAGEILAGGKRYGQGVIPLLALAVGVNDSTVYRCVAMAKLWPQERLFNRDVVNRHMPGGGLIGITSLFAIVGIPEDAQADDIHASKRELLELTFSEGLTLRALTAEIEARYGNKRDGADGKGGDGTGPKTLFGQVQRMADMGEKLAQQIGEWMSVASKGLKSVDPTSLGDRRQVVAERLASDIERFTSLQYQSGVAVDELRKVYAKVSSEK